MTNTPIRVMIVDDHEIVREGLRTLLREEPDFTIVGEASDGAEAVTLAVRLTPDVVLMDLVMPGLNGIEATRRLRAAVPASQVLVLTSYADDQQVRDAIQAGAIGYLLKDVMKLDLLRAIRSAAAGKPTLHPDAQQRLMRQIADPVATSFDSLTERERDVLALIAEGKSNRDIAATLHLTEGTVKSYVSTILDKLNVDDRTQAALLAVKHGLKLVLGGVMRTKE